MILEIKSQVQIVKYIIGKDGNAIAGYTALTRPSSKKFISEIEKALQL